MEGTIGRNLLSPIPVVATAGKKKICNDEEEQNQGFAKIPGTAPVRQRAEAIRPGNTLSKITYVNRRSL
jgi:hypothetical protein